MMLKKFKKLKKLKKLKKREMRENLWKHEKNDAVESNDSNCTYDWLGFASSEALIHTCGIEDTTKNFANYFRDDVGDKTKNRCSKNLWNEIEEAIENSLK